MTVELRKKTKSYSDLTLGQPYAVMGIEGDEFRVLNDDGRPFLYPPSLFIVIDPREPADWISECGEDGERYAYPAALNTPGFFEDFFDDKPKAVRTFWRVVNERLATVSRAA